MKTTKKMCRRTWPPHSINPHSHSLSYSYTFFSQTWLLICPLFLSVFLRRNQRIPVNWGWLCQPALQHQCWRMERSSHITSSVVPVGQPGQPHILHRCSQLAHYFSSPSHCRTERQSANGLYQQTASAADRLGEGWGWWRLPLSCWLPKKSNTTISHPSQRLW